MTLRGSINGRAIKRQIRGMAPSVVFLALAAYFAFNATRGDLGLRAYSRRQADLAAATQNLAQAQAARDAAQRRVTAMQPSHLDPDALDERSRATLNLSAADEMIVPAKN